MKTILFLLALPVLAQTQELALSIGTLRGAGMPPVSAGAALQANYAIRIAQPGPLRIFAAVNLLANPQRKVQSANPVLIRDVASLYLTPELKVQLPLQHVHPFVFAGAGLAVYEHSLLTQAGTPNPGPRTINTGTVAYGAGADVPVRNWLAFRGEIRDHFSGAPVYNVPTSKLHNLSLTVGFVLRWGR